MRLIALGIVLLLLGSAPHDATLPQGAELYDFHCAVCHGATGLGYAEARTAFPGDYQYCERCHNPRNPPRLQVFQMDDGMAFSLGNPPPLSLPENLQGFSNAAALRHYIQQTMPRYQPGRLSDSESLDITAYVLHLRGAKHQVLTEANAAETPVTPQ
jgi:mono/diheme cytochrome c family protein